MSPAEPASPGVSSAPGPLAGVRVLEIGGEQADYAGLLCAGLGASVVKVEPPEGDRTRRLKGFGTGYFGFFNRNKRSLALDLKSTGGQDAAVRLLQRSDVLIENFAPGTMVRLGLDYPAAAKANPWIFLCMLSPTVQASPRPTGP